MTPGRRTRPPLVVIGDGALWIWNLANKIFPVATQIIDIYHARVHIHDRAKLVTDAIGGQQQTWLTDSKTLTTATSRTSSMPRCACP